MTQGMNALVLDQATADYQLRMHQLPIPQLSDGMLLVKVEYAGLNPVDSKLARSGVASWHYPHVPVLDSVGTIVETASPIGQLAKGKRVMWHADLSKQGVLAEYALVPCHAVSPVPDSISPEAAATLPCPGMTAALSICRLGISDGDSVLIEAGAGAVGQFAIQLAKAKGARVLTTASHPHHSYLKKLGADEVFDYKAKDVDQALQLAVGPTGLDAVIDSVCGDNTSRDIDLRKFGGKIAILNELPAINPGLLFTKSPAIHIISLGGAWLDNDLCAQQNMSFMGNLLLEQVADGRLKVPEIIPVAFDAEAVTRAMHRQLAGGLFGKQVVKIA